MRAEEYNIPREKFVLVNENKKLKDKELVTKPVGFFKDAMIRFSKNKGSIFGAIVIAILILYALIVPLFSQYSVTYHDDYFAHILPKVFNSEKIDFLDGAKRKTNNFITFAKDYSIGLETGHNAVKRQEYTVKTYHDDINGDYQMYTYRYDTYQAIGCVFMNLMLDEYLAIQEYQDANDVQIIYPTTDPDKRPLAAQDNKDANYWYETEKVGTITSPINYSFSEDGTLNLTNIYLEYYAPSLKASKKLSEAKKVHVEEVEGGLAIAFINEYVDAETNEPYTTTSFLAVNVPEESNSHNLYLSDDVEDAQVFTIDATKNALLTVIDGHLDSAYDGTYFLGLPASQGSDINIVPIAKIDDADYVPFGLYNDKQEPLTSVQDDMDYYFMAKKEVATKNYLYLNYSILDKATTAAKEAKNASKFVIKEATGGYHIYVAGRGENYYLTASVVDNQNVIGSTTDESLATVFTYDSTFNSFKVTLNGHDDDDDNGEYYLANDYDNNAFVLAKADAFGVNAEPVKIFTSTAKESDGLVLNQNIYFVSIKNTVTYTCFYGNGKFSGDNYNSKMRIEGENNYLYEYARQTGSTYEVRIDYYEYYLYYHKAVLHDRISQPYFIFGTTMRGQDIFTCLASGARFSFLFAIAVAIVNMVVGAIYGAIEGYYGGKIDLVMERIVEILSAVPFMIVITLLKYHMKGSSQALILFISFFLTGWIGMSGTVRMQFYRFKNQEYVLASRTLGASDWRIMFRHIFPNALGTIVTSSVLVIPSMIFSETSLSYLGIINLDSGKMTSVGTLLAAGQAVMKTYPHIILFPAIFISLLMLCFNLFGNGLRDAFNPSLRGTED